LKEIFSPFGEINYVDIHRDPQTGKCKGFAFIQFNRTEDAKVAVRQMNNLPISGQLITVQTVSTAQKYNISAGDEYLYSSGNKTALMNKLSREAPSHSNLRRPPISTLSTPYIVLSNLFKM
jgi:RNA-binding protein 39